MNTVSGEKYRGYPMAYGESLKWNQATKDQEVVGRALVVGGSMVIAGIAIEGFGRKLDNRFISGGVRFLGRVITLGAGVLVGEDIAINVAKPRVNRFLNDLAQLHQEYAGDPINIATQGSQGEHTH